MSKFDFKILGVKKNVPLPKKEQHEVIFLMQNLPLEDCLEIGSENPTYSANQIRGLSRKICKDKGMKFSFKKVNATTLGIWKVA